MWDWLEDNTETALILILMVFVAVLALVGVREVIVPGLTGIFAFLNKESPEEKRIKHINRMERKKEKMVKEIERDLIATRKEADRDLEENTKKIQDLESDLFDNSPPIDELIDSGNSRDYAM